MTHGGLENASRKYSFTDVKKLIQNQQEKYHWEFLFLGANIDAIKVAGSMGINRIGRQITTAMELVQHLITGLLMKL